MSKEVPKWVNDALQIFSAGELQYGAFFDDLVRDPAVKYKPIKERKRFVSGTGIPAYVMKKFQDGVWKPREKSQKKLASFFRRYQFQKYRSLGARRDEARKMARNLDVEKYGKRVADYKRYAEQMGKIKGVDPRYIRYTMSRSVLKGSDWDTYIAAQSATSRTSTLVGALRKRKPSKRKPVKKRPSKKTVVDKYFDDINAEIRSLTKRDSIVYLRSSREEIRRVIQDEKLTAYELRNFKQVDKKLTNLIKRTL